MGVNAAGTKLWLAGTVDGQLIDIQPYVLEMPTGLESGDQLVAFLEDCKRVVAKLRPHRVVVLNPESMAQASLLKARDRATGEAFISLASAQAGIPCDYVSRQKLRATLELPKSGKLADVAKQVVSKPMRPHWKNARDLASLAALAAHEVANS